MASKRPLYDQLSKFSFETPLGFLASRDHGDDPDDTNQVATVFAVLAASAGFIDLLKRTMPRSLKGVSDDILALDAMAYITTSIQKAIYFQFTDGYGERDLELAWLQLMSVAAHIKTFFLDYIDPALGQSFLARWNEFRSVEFIQDRFHMFAYLLFTSKGHKLPMHRYPNSPPLILDLAFTTEAAFAELACAEYLVDAVDSFKRIAAIMREDDDEFEDELEGEEGP